MSLSSILSKIYNRKSSQNLSHFTRRNTIPAYKAKIKQKLFVYLKKIIGLLPNSLVVRLHEFITVTSKQSKQLKKEYFHLKEVYKNNSQELLISVVLPTWNRKTIIQKSINSVLNQSYSNFELIISDDGSTDGTLKFLQEKYAQQIASGKIILLKNEHYGVSQTRNKALEIAKGEFITYLDSDNTWDNHFLLIMVNSLIVSKGKSAYSGLKIKNYITGRYSILFHDTFSYDQLVTKNFIDLNAYIHSKQLLDQHGNFNTSLNRLVDWDLFLRQTQKHSPITVPIAAVNYLIDEKLNNISSIGDFDTNYAKIQSTIFNQKIFKYNQHPFPEKANVNDTIAYVLWQYPTLSETFIRGEITYLSALYKVKVYYLESIDSSVKFKKPTIQTQQIVDYEDLSSKLIEDQIDIIHSHFASPTVTQLVWPAAEKAKIPFTYLSHGVDIFHYNNMKSNKWEEITNSKYCLKTFALGSYHRNFISSEGAAIEKIITRPQHINTAEFKYRPRTTSGPLQICTIGRFVEKKGFENLIRSAKTLNECTFHIYGYGDLEKTYAHLIKSENITNVTIHSRLRSSEEVNQVLRTHDLFVLPCVRAKNGDMDGIPTVLVESMLVGTPVISSRLSSIPDLITDEINGYLIEPGLTNDLINKINSFKQLSSREKQILSNRARKKALQMYDTIGLMNKYTRIWQNKTIDLFLVSYNNLPELSAIINRIYKYTTCFFNLYIIDNNSNESIKKYLTQLEQDTDNLQIELLNENILCGPASNIALQKCKSDYIIYLCSKEGFVMNYDWEWEMIQYMDNHPDVGIAGNTNISPAFSTYSELNNLSVFKNFRNPEFAKSKASEIFEFVQGGVYILRSQMLKEIGSFNNKTPHNHMDVEYSYYAQSKGWKTMSIPSISSLTVKTRPNIEAYFNDSSKVLHPLTIEQAQNYNNALVNGLKHCSICDWTGKQFNQKEECPNCLAIPEERIVYKYFAKSPYIFQNRRLNICPSLKVNFTGIQKMFHINKGTPQFNKKDSENTKYFLESPSSPIAQFSNATIQAILNDDCIILILGDLPRLDSIISHLDSLNCDYQFIEYPEKTGALTNYGIVELKKQ